MSRIAQKVIQDNNPTERIERIHLLIKEECNPGSRFQMYLSAPRMPKKHSETKPVVAETNPRFVKRLAWA